MHCSPHGPICSEYLGHRGKLYFRQTTRFPAVPLLPVAFEHSMSISALGRGVPGCTRCAQHLRLFSSHSVSRESAQKPAYRPRQAKYRPPPRGPSHRDRPTTDRRHAPSSKPTIRFSYEAGNLTQERRAFDAAGAGAESSAATQSSVLSSPADVEDVDGAKEGLTAGRVVEVRRSAFLRPVFRS